jgi:hypothetical protein
LTYRQESAAPRVVSALSNSLSTVVKKLASERKNLDMQRHAEDKMASLNSVLYFMLYVVKRFVLHVPNLPVVLLTTRSADSLAHTDINYSVMCLT